MSGTAPWIGRPFTGPLGPGGNRAARAQSRSWVSEPFARPDTRPTELPARVRPASGMAEAIPQATPEAAGPDCCNGQDAHHDWNATARSESAMQRLDRNYAEILQEIRVAQTGVQLLLAFLLSLAFTPRFGMLSPFDRSLYVTTLILGSASAALLMAPACYHRVVFRQRLKRHLVRAANRFAVAGLGLLGLSLACALLLILKVVVDQRVAVALTGGVVLWFALWWYGLPIWTSLRHRR